MELLNRRRYGERTFPYDTNGYDFVDMGDAGIWATCNVGANIPEEYGFYFAWGETIGYTKEQVEAGEHIFDWDNYKFSINGSSANFSKYNSTDGLTVLELEDDAARVNMGGDWRMPAIDDCRTLLNLCDFKWISDYKGTDLGGTLLTLKTDNSKQLFFPAAALIQGQRVVEPNTRVNVWTNELWLSNKDRSGYLLLKSTMEKKTDPNKRCDGQSVRGFIPKS